MARDRNVEGLQQSIFDTEMHLMMIVDKLRAHDRLEVSALASKIGGLCPISS
uniref:Uncharacterized protein n=1 Tax=Arion vulgaris TaxID=1028688 RepID=A0A0B6ZQH7_9EUPU